MRAATGFVRTVARQHAVLISGVGRV